MLLTNAAPLSSEHLSGVRCDVVHLQTQKAGNHPHECEDNARYDAENGLFALSDGAGEGIFSGEWSRLLVESYLGERSSLAEPGAMSAWLERCRAAWFAQIDYAKLGWAHRARVEKHGAGATLLTLRLYRADAPAFTVQAVGDSCCFWIRANQCRGSFPFAGSGDFPLQPDLFSTHGQQLPVMLQAGDCCAIGDRFVLATDAVSQWLFRMLEAGQPFDWDRLCRMTSTEWQEHIDALRAPLAPICIENDDCTMLVVTFG